MKKKCAERIIVMPIVIIIGFAAMVATAGNVQGTSSPTGPSCIRTCRNNITGFQHSICPECPAGWTDVTTSGLRKREKQRLLHAYAAQRKSANPASPNQTSKGTNLRSAAAAGLSVFALLTGLLLLAKLIHVFLYGLRCPVGQTQRYAGTPLMKKWSFAAASLVAFIGVALVIGSSPGSYAGSSTSPAVPAAAAGPLNPLVGEFSSAIEIGGAGTTQIGGTAIDAAGNLYVTGGFTGSIVFNTAPQTTLTSSQDDDLFVAKYDSSGHPVWARAANGATGLTAGLSLDGGLAVAVDGQGNSYVGGGFVKTLAFKDANNNTLTTLNGFGNMLNFEVFVAKYATNGTLLWAVGGMSGSAQHADDLGVGVNGISDIVVDGAGNPYVGGNVAGTNFLGTPTPASGPGVSSVLVSRLNPATGAPVWVSVTGGERNDTVMGLGIDSAANLYVMGDISSTTTFPTLPPTTLIDSHGFENPFIAKYNNTGQCQWVKQIGGEEFVVGAHLAVNGAGQIYVTGEYDGSVSFGSTTLHESEPGSGEDGLGGFLAKLDTDGETWLWARELGGFGERVALDALGNPYLSGTFFDQAVFGAENPPTSQMLTSMAEEDQYVAKYDAAGNFKFAKALPGDGESSENILHSDKVDVEVVPIRLVYNRLTNTMNVSGDFSGHLMLDNLTLNSGTDRHGFIAGLPLSSPLIISQFRENGPNGTADDFVEIFNTTGSDILVSDVSGDPGGTANGIGVFASLGNVTTSNEVSLVCQIPGNVTIKSHGYFLCASGGYSLSGLGLNGGFAKAVPDQVMSNIADDAGLALINIGTNIVTNTSAGFGATGAVSVNVFDRVGFNPYGASAPLHTYPSFSGNYCEGTCLQPVGDAGTLPTCTDPSGLFPVNTATAGKCYGQSGQYEFMRRRTVFDANNGVPPRDTDHNTEDFIFIAPNPSLSVGSIITGHTGVTSILGAAGPHNSNAPPDAPATKLPRSPFDGADQLGPRNAERRYNLDTLVADPANDPLGTLTLRFKFTNTSGAMVNGLRFEVDDISTLCGPQTATPAVGTGTARNVSATPDCGTGSFTAILKLLNSEREIFVDSGGTAQIVNGTVMEDLSASATPTPPGPLSPLGGGVGNTLIGNPSAAGGSVGDGVTGGTGVFSVLVAPNNVLFVRVKFGVVKNGRFKLLINPQALIAPTP